jgi:ribosomal protein L7/L12
MGLSSRTVSSNGHQQCDLDARELLRRFALLPKRFHNHEMLVRASFEGDVYGIDREECLALGLPLGDTIAFYPVEIGGESACMKGYATGEIAERLFDVVDSAVIDVRVRTVFGLSGEGEEQYAHSGLLIVELLSPRDLRPGIGDSACTLVLDGFDAAKRFAVIKVVREITGLGLKEAKDLIDGAPRALPLQNILSVDEAADIKRRLEECGASVSWTNSGQ